VRSDATPYRYFNDLGIIVYDTLSLPQRSLAEIVDFSAEIGAENARSVRARLSEENAVAGWRKLFATMSSLA
jgi:hypothetical protein